MREYKNILVYALVNLGDVVLTTAATGLLRRAFPKAKITMMARSSMREVLEGAPVIDEFIPFDYRSRKNSFRAMWYMVRDLRDRHFDLAVSYDRKFRPALLCWLAGIPVRVGPSQVFEEKPSRVTWLYTHTVPVVHSLERTLQVETYQAIVRGFLHIGEQTEAPCIASPGETHTAAAAHLLARLPAADKRIALCVKGTFALKTWPKAYFAELVRNLAARYHASFFIVGAPEDRTYAEEVIEELKPIAAANFCGETSLLALAALLRQTDIFITVDTGAAHIAATTGVPMVVMYGCTSPLRWYPVNERASVLSSEEACCPCHYPADGCPSAPRPRCLWNITADMVLERCEEVLG